MKRGKREENGISKPRISYQELLKALLDFQLDGHERFLKPFLEKFKAVDQDKDGILNETEFKGLLSAIGLLEDGDRLLELADPFETNMITFSDCVGLLNSVINRQERVEDGPDRSVSVLEKLYSNFKEA